MNTMELTVDQLNSETMTKIFNYELRNIRSSHDKEDVKQSCILRILTAVKDKDFEKDLVNFPSFCQTIIQRTVTDYIRYRKRKIESYTTTMANIDYAPSQEQNERDCSSVVVGYNFKIEHGYALKELHSDYERNRHLFSKQEKRVLDYMLYNSTAMSRRLAEIARDVSVDRSRATRAVNKLRELAS